jgi:hypothetical protein
MYKLVYSLIFSLLLFPALQSGAQDDVYDAPRIKEVKIKKQAPVQEEKVVPYYEEDESSSNRSRSAFSNGNANDNRYSDSYTDDNLSGFGYAERIRRFHNPSIRFSYSYGSMFNSWNDPWYNSFDNGWYNSFTPSWMSSYNNFYNPFWGGNQIIIINQPWISSWYNAGFYNPWNSWGSTGWNSWNNWGWNSFSPWCSNVIYNNTFNNYGGYYDYNRKNVVYTRRRTGGFSTNTNTIIKTNPNFNPNNASNTNNPNIINNSPSSTGKSKWNKTPAQNNSNSAYPDVYRPHNSNNTYDRSNTVPPTHNNNNGWNKNTPSSPDNTGGIRIGTKPK